MSAGIPECKQRGGVQTGSGFNVVTRQTVHSCRKQGILGHHCVFDGGGLY